VDKLNHVQTSELGGVYEHQALLLIVVAGHSDDSVLDTSVSLRLRKALAVSKDHGDKLFRKVSRLGVFVVLQCLLVY